MIESEATENDGRSAAMAWIGSLLENIANCLGVEITSWQWEICGSGDDATSYQLIIVGRGDRRAIKLFTAAELDRCLSDPELQTEFNVRLTPLVIFIGNRVNSKSTSKAVVRRRQQK